MGGRSAKGTKRYGGSGSHSSLSGKMANDMPVIPNYPWEGGFENTDQIDMYLSGKSITCLICGHEYAALGKHLAKHAMNSRDYKVKFNIPLRYALCVKRLTEIKSLMMKAYNKSETQEQKEVRKAKCRANHKAFDRDGIPKMSQNTMLEGAKTKTGKNVNRQCLEKVDVPCSECGVLHKKSAFTTKRERLLCPECKHEANKSAHKKYRAKNMEKRRKAAREHYKRKKQEVK